MFCRLKHEPEQLVSPAPHMFTHAPAWHACPGPHVRPHMPQLVASVRTFTHLLPQRVKPCAALHWHWPLKQLLFTPPQALPQAPQLFTSNWVNVQVPLQFTEPPMHIAEHMPNAQT